MTRPSQTRHRKAGHHAAGRHPSRALIAGALMGAAVLAVPAVASAQTGAGTAAPGIPAPPADANAPRFSFAPVEGGALKLDRVTGRVSLCAKGPTGYTCEAVPDSRDAFEAEIARLQKEIAALKAGAGPNAGTGTAPDGTSEFDQALDYAERIYRRLRTMIEGFSSGSGERI